MGFLQRIAEKYAAAKQHRTDRNDFKNELLAAVSDGVLTDEEIDQLESLKSSLGISDVEVRGMRVKAYETAFRAIKADGAVTAREEKELQRIQLALSIPDSELTRSREELARLRLINEIQNGNLPIVTVRHLVPQKGEEAHWSEPASLIEERVVGRRYVGASHGLSFRIAKGFSYRVGASRGRLIVDKANVAVSSGDLVITNKRLVFRGDKKSFSYRLDKVVGIELYSDGLSLTDSSGKHRTVSFESSRNNDILGGILTQAINRHAGGA